MFPSLQTHLKRLGLLLGYYRPSGARKGVFDIVACCQIRRYGIALGVGQFVAIDVKNDLTGDKISKDQLAFMEETKRSGGMAITVSSYGEFLSWYAQSPFIKIK